MRRSWIVLLLSLAMISLLLTLAGRLFAPKLIRNQLTHLLSTRCKSCSWDAERIDPSFFPPRLSLHRVRLQGGDPKTTAVIFEIKEISTKISVRRLFSGEISLSETQIRSPQVEVIEGDLPVSWSSESTSENAGKGFSISIIQIHDGSFTYTREYGDQRKAQIRTKDLQGSVDSFSNAEEFRERPVKAVIRGQLEHSGSFELEVITPPLSKPLSADVTLKIADQNLADLSLFFQTSEGVLLQGSLYEGKGVSKVRGTRLQSRVFAQYRNLDVKLQKTKERSAIAAFFSNLAASLKTVPTDIGKKREDQARVVELQRNSKETLLQWILRGMRDAALQIMTQG